MIQFSVIMYTKFSNSLSFKIIVCLISLLLFSQKVCAEEAEELRQEILELEKVVNPFVRIFQKVSRLVAPSVVSIVAEGAYGTSTNPHEEGSSPFVHPKKKGGESQNSNKPSFGSGIVIKKQGISLLTVMSLRVLKTAG